MMITAPFDLANMVKEIVWERFYQAPTVEVLSGSGVGLGLGLHSSKTIIEQHQGQVGVESVEDEGSTFWLEPCYAQQRVPYRGRVGDGHAIYATDGYLCGALRCKARYF